MSQRVRLTRAKVVILGAAGAGKTALVVHVVELLPANLPDPGEPDGALYAPAFAVRYITKRFIGEYDPNKEMIYTHKVPFDRGEELPIEILDTANDSSRAILENHIKWADGYILMYSITDRNSFHKLTHYHALARSMRKPECTLPLVMVGNKRDLEHVRSVSEKEANDMASKFGCPSFEISIAEAPEGVAVVMEEVLQQVKKELVRSVSCPEKRGALNNMKRVLRRKMARSKSDTLS